MNVTPRRRPGVVTLTLLALLLQWTSANAAGFDSRFYRIEGDLTPEQARPYAEHMDRVFAEYQSRFKDFRSRRTGKMPLYLFGTRAAYVQFMASRGIESTNSGGMFFVGMRGDGLATFTEGQSPTQTFSVLQHEGFHQFAFNYIGPDLPVWVNEGLAQYFEDGVLVKGHLELGLADKDRIERVRQAIEKDEAVDFDALLTMSHEQWGRTLATQPEQAALNYAQSWSVVYFLVHGNGGKYRGAFVDYLQSVSRGVESSRAFARAFGSNDTRAFRQRWEEFARKQEPDALTATMHRMQFLGQALMFLQERKEPTPRTIEELKTKLQAMQFRIRRASHGLSEEVSAKEDALFTYPRAGGGTLPFELLEPARDDLPPRVRANPPKMQATLVWTRTESGGLQYDIELK